MIICVSGSRHAISARCHGTVTASHFRPPHSRYVVLPSVIQHQRLAGTMDKEEQKKPDERALEGADGAAPMPAPSSDVEPGSSKGEKPHETHKKPVSKKGGSFDLSTIGGKELLDGRIGKTLRDLDTNARLKHELGLVRSPIDDIIARRDQFSGVTGAIADAQKAMQLAGGIGGIRDQISKIGHISEGLNSIGGIEKIMRQQREIERTMFGLGSIGRIAAEYNVMRDAVTARGGIDSILKRHDEMNKLALGSLASAKIGYAASAAYAANSSIQQALRDISGVTSFAGLLGHGGLNRDTLDELISGTQKWREASGSLSLSATLHAQLPDLIPERRRVTAADIASATLSNLGERYARDSARFGRLREEMLGLRRPWVDVGNPSQSVAAYVDARALATIVADGPPESRAVVTAVREELGDYRETDPVNEVIAADPVLRAAFRLEVGYNPDLSSLPPAIIATVFGDLGGGVPRNVQADPDAIESVVHQRARRLELKLRRFIERKMMDAYGPKWSKQRVKGEVLTRWRQRRQLDMDNGRTPSRLFDYAGFEDYREIIENGQNWEEVFKPIYKVKTSILETLRRLSLIRNPDAHYRVMTIEDFIDLHAEGRRLDLWMDAAER